MTAPASARTKSRPRCTIPTASITRRDSGTSPRWNSLSIESTDKEESDAAEHQGTYGSAWLRRRVGRDGRSRPGVRNQADQGLRQIGPASFHSARLGVERRYQSASVEGRARRENAVAGRGLVVALVSCVNR